MQDLTDRGHLKGRGNALNPQGAVVKKGAVNDGPYAESKDIVIGYSLIEARDLAEATALAAGCPVLESGGVVEVRVVWQL
jgi:hypothetical protein